MLCLLALTCEAKEGSDYGFATAAGEGGEEVGTGGAGRTSGGTSGAGPGATGGVAPSTGGSGGTTGSGGRSGGTATGGAPNGGDSSSGTAGVVDETGGLGGETATGGAPSDGGGVAEGGTSQGGSAGEPTSEGGTTTGSGGTVEAGAAGAAGDGGAPPDACPSDPPGILTTFENDLYTTCPPWDGFWAHTLDSAGVTTTACPTSTLCSIFSGATEGHGRALAFRPTLDVYSQYLTLDLRQNTDQPLDASDYVGIAFDAIAIDIGVLAFYVQAHTADTIEIEGGSGGEGEPGGACLQPGGDCGFPYEAESSISGIEWGTVTIPFTDFVRDADNNPVPFDPSQLLYLRLYAIDGTFGFDIDNVRFVSSL